MSDLAIAGTNDAAVALSTARHSKVMQAAQQFEAVMLGELMKPLGTSSAIGEDDAGDGGNALQGYGVEAMAGALARSGALGFASRIAAAVEKSLPAAPSEKALASTKVFTGSADNATGGTTS